MNTIITSTWVGREILRVAANKLRFAGSITKYLSDEFKVAGTKVGATVNVRLPQRFVTNKGQALQLQPITDQVVPITITDQANIGYSYSSFVATMEIEEARKKYVDPAAIQIANTIDLDGLERSYQDVANLEGTPGTVPVTNVTYLNAAARLTNMAAPSSPRIMIVNALMRVGIANANLSLFNPSGAISELWRDGMFGAKALSWDEWYEDVNVFPHVVGPLGGTPLVNGASQTGSALVTDGWTAAAANRLKKGDVFTIAGVNSVNPQSYKNTTQLAQFVVTADTNSDGSGNATIPIYPPLILTGALQTVTALPADNAALTVVGAASTVTPQGLGYHPEAFVMASADLEMPLVGKAERIRAPGIGLSLRFWMASDIMTDQHPARLDVIYGFKTVRPEWAVRIAS